MFGLIGMNGLWTGCIQRVGFCMVRGGQVSCFLGSGPLTIYVIALVLRIAGFHCLNGLGKSIILFTAGDNKSFISLGMVGGSCVFEPRSCCTYGPQRSG